MTNTQWWSFLGERLWLIAISIILAIPALAAHGQGPRNSLAVGVTEGEKHLLTRVDPAYPQVAKQAHLEGKVILRATVSSQGTVAKVAVVSGPPMLIAAAVDAVKQWQYAPFLREGQPVEALVTVEVLFSLPLSSAERSKADFSKQASKCGKEIEAKQYAAAEIECKAVIDLLEKLPASYQRSTIEAYRREGDALFYQNKYSQALTYYHQELALAESETDVFYPDQDQAQGHYDVARALQGAGSLQEAQAHYERAVAILEKARSQAEMLGVDLVRTTHGKALQPLLRDYSSLLRQSGDLAAALAAEHKADAIATELKTEQTMVDQYTPQQEQCNQLSRKAQYIEAEAACKAAIEISEKLPQDHWGERMQANFLEAEALLQQKKASESMAYYQRALALAQKYLHGSPGEAGALHAVARALAATGDYEQAHAYVQRAIDAYTQACEKMKGPLADFKPQCESQLQSVLRERADLSRPGDPSPAPKGEQKSKSIPENDSRKPSN